MSLVTSGPAEKAAAPPDKNAVELGKKAKEGLLLLKQKNLEFASVCQAIIKRKDLTDCKVKLDEILPHPYYISVDRNDGRESQPTVALFICPKKRWYLQDKVPYVKVQITANEMTYRLSSASKAGSMETHAKKIILKISEALGVHVLTDKEKDVLSGKDEVSPIEIKLNPLLTDIYPSHWNGMRFRIHL